MAGDLPESDWKVFRRLREVALERFCRRVLEEVGRAASKNGGKYHDRYLEVYRLLDRRDDELGRAFNNPRRSSAAVQLALIQAHSLLTAEEMAQFSPETQQIVGSLLAVHRRKER